MRGLRRSPRFPGSRAQAPPPSRTKEVEMSASEITGRSGTFKHRHNVAVHASMLAGVLAFCMMEASIAMADQATFAQDAVGASPKGWTATMTGNGNPKWTVEEDPT